MTALVWIGVGFLVGVSTVVAVLIYAFARAAARTGVESRCLPQGWMEREDAR